MISINQILSSFIIQQLFYVILHLNELLMTRILTGIQSSGKPHLGNLLGAILPAIEMSKHPNTESLFFIADMHSLITIKDTAVLRENTYSVAAAWLACGLDTKTCIFYRQSDLSMVCELAWIFNCLTPFPDRKSTRLNSSHSTLSRMPSSA